MSSIQTAFTQGLGPTQTAQELHRKLSPAAPKLVLYFATSTLDLPALAAAMEEAFAPATVIGCQWPQASRVRLAVYDLLGREVARLIDGVRPAGSYQVTFDGTNLPSGLYFYRLAASPAGTPAGAGKTVVRTKAMVLTR